MADKQKMHCPICSKAFKEDVVMDIFNTVSHFECFPGTFPAKEFGSFKKIIESNDFFYELLDEIKIKSTLYSIFD